MVLGLRSKTKKSNAVHVEYTIHVLEIKPWPPSQSLKSLRSVGLYWENGEKSSGSLNPVAPTLGNGAGEGKIEFNESFRLKVTLLGEASAKGGNANVFQKNCLELSLFEPRRDRTVKSQLLGSVVIDLAEYGIIKESVVFSAPMNCKRSFWNTAQPLMLIKIQPFDKDGSSSSSFQNIPKEASLDKDYRESVSALMNEEYAEEEEIASFTDDDVSSHSSLTISSSVPEKKADLAPQNGTSDGRKLQEENESAAVKESLGKDSEVPGSPSEPVLVQSRGPSSAINPSNAIPQQGGLSSRSSSTDLSSGPISPASGNGSTSNFTERSLTTDGRNSFCHSFQSFSSSVTYEATEEEVISNNCVRSMGNNNSSEVHEKVAVDRSKMQYNNRLKEGDIGMKSSSIYLQVQEKANLPSSALCEACENREAEYTPRGINGSEEASDSNVLHEIERKDGDDDDKPAENGEMKKIKIYSNLIQNEDERNHLTDNSFDSSAAGMAEIGVDLKQRVSQDAIRKAVVSAGEQLAFSMRGLGGKGSSFTTDRLNHTKFPVRLPLDALGAIPSVVGNEIVEEVKEVDISCDAHNGPRSTTKNPGKNVWERSMSADRVKHINRDVKNSFSDGKVQELESKVEILEAELREAAVVELGLYSVVAEHGSSAHKVHAPARRLSRLYTHALRRWSLERRASIARSAASGLVLVAKACGNDVPRLTFWWSNSVVLRAIIAETTGEKQVVSAKPHVEMNSVEKRSGRKSSMLKRNDSSSEKKEISFSSDLNDWKDPWTFSSALEKIEAWIFSRIIESVWWQTLTPHMQSSPERSRQKTSSNSKKSYGRISSLNDQEQCDFSVNHWEKAFKDAYERICPVRAGGHECGCLPMLARLVMEQCVARLDVAMFNAILRESDDEIPTDPISDPISDPKVLPIPAGKSSFGCGAQLKNAIGSWSRWLTGLFGIDADDSLEGETEKSTERQDDAGKFKAFYLLNALSDLLMLPKDMLLDQSIRKEVCPTLGASLIKRVLDRFVPDEFCPEVVPKTVLESLESEDPLEANEGSVTSFPCNASSICYSPPSAASVSSIVGDLKNQSQLRRSGSSVLRKCHTSDDELDELDSPLTSIVINSSLASSPSTPAEWKLKQNSSSNTLRFQLLREVWEEAD